MNPPVAIRPSSPRLSVSPMVVAMPCGSDWFGDTRAQENLAQTICSATDWATDPLLLKEAALRNSESELHLLSAALMTMLEMERKRIASDLHDSIGQSLCALNCGIATALASTHKGSAEVTRLVLEQLASQVKDTIIEVQRIAMNLRPAMLDDIGLIPTLAWFFREFRAIHPELALNTDIAIDECDIRPSLRTVIFRVVQEAVNNIVKHSCASGLNMRLRRVNHEIHLEVADNGIGFVLAEVNHPALTGTGMGLKGMRERAEFSGGRFRLISHPGTGTTVFVVWPIPD